MDQSKTWIPRLVFIPKSLQNLGISLPVALTRMLTHGREPNVYAHLSISSIWPGDSDFTVTSIAKCLRDLEEYDGDKSGDILNSKNSMETRALFKSLLDYKAFEKSYLEPKKNLCGKVSCIRRPTDHLILARWIGPCEWR